MPFGFFEKHGLKLYKNFIVLTESMQDHIQKHQKEGSFAVIPNGVDDQLFELPVTPGEYIFYLGLIDFELKGVDLLLEAYARQSPASRLPLVLAGHCHDRKRLDERIAELKLGSSVQLLGKIDAQKRLTLMQNARFVCVPSRWETFCMVAAEACAAATPVIVFDIPPLNEVVPPQGCRLVPPFGVGQLASALEDLSSTPDATIIEMGQICRTFAQRYRWDIVAEAQENFFLEVVQKTTK